MLTAQFYGEAGPALVDMANERGGDDNITCVIVYAGNESGPTAPERRARLRPLRSGDRRE